MPRLRINGAEITVADGATLLDAAAQAGVDIPTMCYLKDLRPMTSCMVCVVKDTVSGRMLPSCTAPAEEGMNIETESAEVRDARKEILQLLLSEHLGDCEAPCRRTCPSSMNIPLMTRQLVDGDVDAAAWTAKDALVIPATLGYVCPAPCERGCRRGQHDEAIKIRELHRFAAMRMLDQDRETPCVPASGKRVAVIGAGPAGLAAAWMSRRYGHACRVYEQHDQSGGKLRNLSEEELPKQVLDAEIASIERAGVEFALNTEVGGQGPFEEMAGQFDAVIVACGGLPVDDESVFAAPEHKLAVRAVANGKKTAAEANIYLSGDKHEEPSSPCDSRMGRLRESEVALFLSNTRHPGTANGDKDMKAQQAEAGRCLHCDCRTPVSCRLREYARQYGATQSEYRASERAHFEIAGRHHGVVYEKGKCIKCGLCIEIVSREREALGLSFVGRGYNVRVAVPFGGTLDEGLKASAKACVEACPTGALAFEQQEERKT